MSRLLTRPNGIDTGVSFGGSVVGAATAWQALADDGDGSYIVVDDNCRFYLLMAEPAVPAGAMVKSARFHVRIGAPPGLIYGATMGCRLNGYGGISPSPQNPWLPLFDDGDINCTETIGVGWIDPVTVASHEVKLVAVPTDLIFDILRFQPAEMYVYEVYADTIYVEKPVVVVNAPSGTIGYNQPGASWVPDLDPDGGPQTAAFVKFFDEATYSAGGFNPETATPVAHNGITTSQITWWNAATIGWPGFETIYTPQLPPGGRLADGNYKAYVKIAQHIDGVAHWSDWTAGDVFEVDAVANAPDEPTIAVTGDSANGRVQITLTPNGTLSDSDFFHVQREIETDVWQDVRTPLGNGLIDRVGSSVTLYNYEAGNGELVTYRARAGNKSTTSYTEQVAYSEYVEDDGSWESNKWWVKHPTLPSMNLEVTVRSQPTRNRTARKGVFQARGATTAIVTSDTYSPWTGDIVFKLESDDDRDALDRLVVSTIPLLVQAPADAADWPDTWLAFMDYSRDRVIDSDMFQLSFDSLAWNEVERPLDALLE